MEMSDQPTAPAVLPPEGSFRYLLNVKLGGTQSRSESSEIEKNLMSLLGFRLLIFLSVA
jgi:hypothetical protein